MNLIKFIKLWPLLLVFRLLLAIIRQCPSGWTRNGGQCYFFCHSLVNQNTAAVSIIPRYNIKAMTPLENDITGKQYPTRVQLQKLRPLYRFNLTPGKMVLQKYNTRVQLLKVRPLYTGLF